MLDKAKICISFDDGRKDNIAIAKEILKPQHIPATFFISSGLIDGTLNGELVGNQVYGMNWDDIAWLRNNNFEIATHSANHTNQIEDIIRGYRDVLNVLEMPCHSKLGWSSPRNEYNNDLINTEFFHQNISYVAVGPRFEYRFTDKLLRMISRKTGCDFLKAKTYKYSLMDIGGDKLLYRIPVENTTNLSLLKCIVDDAIKKRKAAIFNFHSISINSNLHWTYPQKDFSAFCNFLVKKEKHNYLNIVTVEELNSIINKDE